MKIKPLFDRILVKVDTQDTEKKLASGIYVASKDEKDESKKQGIVIEVGPGTRSSDGTVIPTSVNVGDRVIFSWGEKIIVDSQEYEIVREDNILAIIS